MALEQVGHDGKGGGTKVVLFCSPPLALDRVVTGIGNKGPTTNAESTKIPGRVIIALKRIISKLRER
jgi:hypothetical protein